MLGRLTSALYLRRLVSELHHIGEALTVQNTLLARLADHLAPVTPSTSRSQVQAETGVSFLDPIEQGLALDYIARTQRDTGHVPDDDEVLIYLADEKTTDLAARLTAREQEMERLADGRAWRS